MPNLPFLDRIILGATVWQWLIATATLVGAYFALVLLRRVLVSRIGALAARSSTHWDDLIVEVLRKTRRYFLFILALQAARRVIPADARTDAILDHISVIVVLLQVGVWGSAIIGITANRYASQRGADDVGARTTIQAMGYAGRFVLWALLFITGLDHFGIQVTALITGLGIGGIAVALAVQNILGDLFGALAIVLDKPFVVGDFIIVDNVMGTVEQVGLKTTRLRSLGGEQIIVSNNDLLKSRIRNYKRMEQRRVVFTVDVRHGTPADKVDRAPRIIREIVESLPLTRFDRSHFMLFAESTLRIETVYYVLDADYNKYADIQHAINVEILRRFGAERIDIGLPTRISVQTGDGPSLTAIT